jgi:hypothetical protein
MCVPLVSGCAGVIAGLVALFHERLDDVVAQSVLVWLFAIVILLTGLSYILAGFKAGDELERERSRRAAFWRPGSGVSPGRHPHWPRTPASRSHS